MRRKENRTYGTNINGNPDKRLNKDYGKDDKKIRPPYVKKKYVSNINIKE